ncbi:hypothetical protein [Kutzneria kofuensis]|uniref:hypothetical protein n=1 Tax=Kutzneria kofuensis TaxID=103725 RepID=UPI003CD08AEA
MILYSRWASRHSTRSSSPCRLASSLVASVDLRTSDSRNIARIRSGACTFTAPSALRACAVAFRRSAADASSTVPPSRNARRASYSTQSNDSIAPITSAYALARPS